MHAEDRAPHFGVLPEPSDAFVARFTSEDDIMIHRGIAELEAFASYAQRLCEGIEQIEADRELLRSGHQLMFAVDFATVRRFLEPRAAGTDGPGIAMLIGEKPESALIREQLALSFIFGPLGHDLLLLPPHLMEMSDYYHLRGSLYEKGPLLDRRRFAERVSRSLVEHEHFDAISAALKRDPAGRALTSAKNTKLGQFAARGFKELAFVAASGPSPRAESHEPVRHILKRLGILPSPQRFDDPSLAFDSVLETSAKWKSASRNGSKPAPLSQREILACEYVERTNALINPGKEALFLITSSPELASALGEKEIIQTRPGARPASAVRDLNYFWLQLLHRRENPEEMLEALRRTKASLEGVRRVLRDAAEPSAEPHQAHLARSAVAALEAIGSEFARRENISLALGAFGDPLAGGRGISGAHSAWVPGGVLSILQLVSSNAKMHDRLRADQLASDAAIDEHLSNLDLLLNFRRLDGKHIHGFRSFSTPKEKKLVLESFRPEMPAEVSLYAPQLRRLGAELSTEHGREPSNRTLQSAILELAGSRPGDPELHGVKAYLFMAVEHWTSALSELHLAMRAEAVRGNVMLELLHLKAAAHRAQGQTEEGLLWCVKGLAIDPSDPRLNREIAVLLWQVLQNGCPKERSRLSALAKELVGDEPDYVMALDYADRALASIRSDDPDGTHALRARSLNTFAYLALELFRIRRDLTYLNIAEQRMTELMGIVPEKRWAAKFHHTMGCILYHRWDLSRENTDDLRTAKRHLKESTADPSLAPQERSMYDKDFQQVAAMLLRLGHSDQADRQPVLQQQNA